MAGDVQVQLRHVRFGGELKVWKVGWLDIKIQWFFYGDMGHEDVRICKDVLMDVLMDVTSHIKQYMECMGLPGLVLK